MEPRVFISYRHQDNPLYANLLKEYLSDQLGPGNVFFDMDSIPYGVDFVRTIEDAIRQCTCLIAVIGPGWTSRMDDPHDYVRLEIEISLNLGIPIIPVFIADVPSVPQDLPASIARVRTLNGIHLRSARDERLQAFQAVHSSVIRLAAEAVERQRRAAAAATSFDRRAHTDAAELLRTGVDLLERRRHDEAITYLELAAQNGSAAACHELIEIYGRGVVKPQDMREVAKWSLHAARLGDREGKFMIGMGYAYGIGVEQDFREAERWLQMATAEGHDGARSLLGQVRSPLLRWNLKAMAKLKLMEWGLKAELRE